ncbi:MAG TPA: hypothetical protein ENK05_11505 [Gammaproteobacteria bacterium]|nr:hypothetical protein [Gammaproteobacteria bacterium]
MSPEQYRQTYRHNLKSARHLVESYSRKTLSSIGVPKAGIDLIGAAAAFAVTQDAGVHLGRSNLLSVGVRNAADNDRSVFLGIKVDW